MQKVGEHLRPTILCVASKPSYLATLTSHLSRSDYALVSAEGTTRALHVLGSQSPDLVVVDSTEARDDSIRLCAQIKSVQFICHIPIVAILPRDPAEDATRWLEARVNRLVYSPYDRELLKSHFNALLRRSIKLDSVTHIPTVGYLHGQLDVWLASNLPTAVLYTDIDNFGAFAATHGQEAAERVIVRVAHLLVDALPHDNVAAAHLGGDRFMAILPPDGAKTIAQTVVELFRYVRREFYPTSHSDSPHAHSPGRVRHAARPLSLSAVLVTNEKRTLTNYMQVSATVATLMREVKERGGDQAAIA